MKNNKLKNEHHTFSNLAKWLLVAVIFSFTSCSQSNVNKKNTNVVLLAGGDDIKIIVVDSCEYLFYSAYSRMGLVHKGNCKFCLTRRCEE